MAIPSDETLPDDGAERRRAETPQETTAQLDVVLFRRYRLIRELGRGGMGVVMLAHDMELDIQVAVKLVPDMVLKDREAIADLRREVLRGMALLHQNIVRTHNFERDDQTAGVIMEYVEGETLADLKLRQPGGCFEWYEIIPWVEQLCTVLEYAHHEARIIHRDLKPRNLLLGRNSRLKVADFGISASLNDSRSRQSMDGATSGTPSYMSPQQAEGRRPSLADDIHAVGATIYELLTGKPPFFRGNATAIFGQILNVVPPSMADRREELEVTGKAPIPPAWEAVIASCLAKDPALRPASAGAIIAQLKAAAIQPVEPTVIAPPPQPIAPAEPASPRPHLDENVQFTVYRQPMVEPLKWYPLLAFAHLAERPANAPADVPDPVEEVQRQAKAVLGKAFDQAVQLVQDSRLGIPKDGEITFVPEVDGVTFNPPRSTFVWSEPVHRAEFRMRAEAGTDGRTLRGRVTVFLGHLILAEIPLTVPVKSGALAVAAAPVVESARPYRRIFASYSHLDVDVVAQFREYAEAMGDRYLDEAIRLRAEERWDERLRDHIRQADIFQLFWSSNSMKSRHCREEWEYALSLGRKDFVRPTYWETPFPRWTEAGLPDARLEEQRFQRIGFTSSPPPPPSRPRAASPEPEYPTETAFAAPPAAPSPSPTAAYSAPPPPPPVSAPPPFAAPPAAAPLPPRSAKSNWGPLAIAAVSVVVLGVGTSFFTASLRRSSVGGTQKPARPEVAAEPGGGLAMATPVPVEPPPLIAAATPVMAPIIASAPPPEPEPIRRPVMVTSTPLPTPALAIAPPPAATPPPSATPEPAPAVSPTEAIRAVLEGYTRALSSDGSPDVGQYFADRVDYQNLGNVPRSSIERDVANDARTWPDRKHAIEGTPVIRLQKGNRAEATYVANYEVRNAKGVSYGRLEMKVLLDVSDPQRPLITSMKSNIITARKNQKKDKL